MMGPFPVPGRLGARACGSRDRFMCGIAGFVNRDGEAADRDVLARMTATLAHRGPDGDGFYLDGPAAPRASPALDHRPGRRRPADVQRGRLGLGHVQRRALQRAGAAGGADRAGARLPDDLATPRASSTSTKSTAPTSPGGSTACSPWRSGTPAAAGSSWHATGWARSRSIYAETPGGGLVFGSEPKALLAAPGRPPPARPGRPGALPLL